ncbi:MAG TPA: EAL domain-containing protein [Jatrophihabitans sp.]|jgi:EAL domain-containing protein (putative c-di-GMP-specific phosphodiesterase class I)|uniref:EAL domain-containing protein n=1 Tax=Jatrophihabitans sp. TaxID=1932789 RepID=UPI002DFFC7DE|nr:EAL domain-containing protein [Jatrophihabitans sp.]
MRKARPRRRRRELLHLLGRDVAIEVAFHPIVDARTGAVLGHAAVTRFPGPIGHGPAEWFADARTADLAAELELRAVAAALRRFRAGDDGYVALDVSPETMARGELLPLLLAGPVPASRVVVELTEHSPVEDYEAVRRAREAFRAHGIRLAVDDAGSGYASFRRIVATDPDIIKIDRSLVVGVHADAAKTELVRSIVTLARARGADTVAEGVQDLTDATRGAELGVDALQGTLVGGPR